MDPTNSEDHSYELMPVCTDAQNDDDEELIPSFDVQHPEKIKQMTIFCGATTPAASESEKSVEHTSSQIPAKTDSPASANDEGRNLIHIRLPETLVDSCLLCITHVQSIEVQLNEMEYDKFSLFENLSYAKDIEAQLRKGQILISVIGCHNAGKSTLINAILGDELLPQRNKNETGIRVYIQDCPDHHRGPCTDSSGKCSKCPELMPFCNGILGEKRYRGRKEINSVLHTLNQRSRNNPKEDICPYLLLVNVPVLRGAPRVVRGQQVYLVDTPGLGDSKRSIAELAEKSVLTSPAYIYVINYNNLEDERDSNAFKRICGKDREVLDTKRLSIAVTHYDTFFESSDDESDSDGDESSNFSDEEEVHDVKTRVSRQLQSALGLNSSVPHELINLVSGKWALKARKSAPSQQNLLRLGKHLETYYKRASHHSDEAVSHDVAEKLLAASGIRPLEKRIEVLVCNSYASWVKNMRANCLSYLEYATSKIKEATQKHEAWKQHSDRQGALLDSAVYIWVRLHGSASGKFSEVYDHLKCGCRKDFDENVLKEAQELTAEQCNSLQKRCIEKAAKKYKRDEFASDVVTFLKELSSELTKRFSEATLENVFLTHNLEFEDMNSRYEIMMRDACLLCQHSKSNISTTENQEQLPSPESGSEATTENQEELPSPESGSEATTENQEELPSPESGSEATTENQEELPSPESGSEGTHDSTPPVVKTVCPESTLNLSELMNEIIILPFERNLIRRIERLIRVLLGEQLPEELWNLHFHLSDGCPPCEQDDTSGPATDSETDTPSPELSSQATVTPPSWKLSKEQVENATEQLKKFVLSQLQNYSEELVTKVASHFYEKYNDELKMKLSIFKEETQEDFQEACRNHEKESEEKAMLDAYIEEMKHHHQQLKLIYEHIRKKADEDLSHQS